MPAEPVFALEIAALGLSACADGSDAPDPSPARAALTEDGLLVGEDLPPEPSTRFFDAFWANLNRTACGSFPDGRPLSHSAIAYHHVSRYWKAVWEGRSAGSAALALPLEILNDDERMGLVLGMAESLGLGLRGLVPAPLAAAAAAMSDEAGVAERVAVVDLELDGWRITRTRLGEDGLLAIEAMDALPELGYRAIENEALRAWGGRFLAEHAFDIHHTEATERAFREAVARGLLDIASARSAEVVLKGRRERRLTLSLATATELTANLADHVGRRLALTLGAFDGRVVLTPRARLLPGVEGALGSHLTHPPVVLSTGAIARETARLAREWPVAAELEAVPEFTRLRPSGWTGRKPIPAPPPANPAEAPPPATHYLLGHVARPLPLKARTDRMFAGDSWDSPGGSARLIHIPPA